MSIMNVIAVDPSMHSTGVYLRIGNWERSLAIEVPKCCTVFGAIDRIRCELTKALRLFSGRARPLGIVERYAYGAKNSKFLVSQGEIGGAVRYLLWTHRIPYIEISPATWKSITMGPKFVHTRKKTKRAQREYLDLIRDRWGREFDTSDEADAWLMAQAVELILTNAIHTKGAESVREDIAAKGFV